MWVSRSRHRHFDTISSKDTITKRTFGLRGDRSYGASLICSPQVGQMPTSDRSKSDAQRMCRYLQCWNRAIDGHGRLVSGHELEEEFFLTPLSHNAETKRAAIVAQLPQRRSGNGIAGGGSMHTE